MQRIKITAESFLSSQPVEVNIFRLMSQACDLWECSGPIEDLELKAEKIQDVVSNLIEVLASRLELNEEELGHIFSATVKDVTYETKVE